MDEDPDAALAAISSALADTIEAVVGPWGARAVRARAAEAGLTGPRVEERAERAGQEVEVAVVARVRALLAQDVDEQATTPLAVIRAGIGPATAALRELGVPPVERDEFTERTFPDDVYALTPASWDDVAPELQGPGVEWGAAKAFVHLSRRRPP